MIEETTLSVPQGTFELRRYPAWSQSNRRAWDAADAYALRFLAETWASEMAMRASVTRAVVLFGGQGSLAVALASALGNGTVVSVGDSFVDERATRANLAANDQTATCVDVLDAGREVAGAQLLVVKVPKSIALLEDALARIAPLLAPGAQVVGAGMTRHVHNSTVDAFTRFVGPTTTSPARQKARLLMARVPVAGAAANEPSWPRTVDLGDGRKMVNHAGVFSADRLDAGTALLLDHLPEPLPADQADAPRVVDLGCGNGIVGVTLAAQWPDARVTFVDESYLAVASALATAVASLGQDAVESDRLRFAVGDGLDAVAGSPPIEDGSIDLVLVNPPFHDDHAIGDGIAWQMFTQARRALRVGGEIRVVGNRHLAYHAKLKRLFGNVDVIASTPKFVVVAASRVR